MSKNKKKNNNSAEKHEEELQAAATAADEISADEVKQTEKAEEPIKEEKEPVEKTAKEESEDKPKKRSRRNLKYGSISTAITVVTLVAVVLVNVVLNLASNKVNMSLDLTVTGAFEISQETIDYINSVNEPVEIVCMSDEQTFQTSNYIYFKHAYEVLKKYTLYGDNITLTFVDMIKNPTYAERYKSVYQGDITEQNIVVESAKRIKVLSIDDLFNYEINYNTFSQEIVSSKAEQSLTSALMYVTDPNPVKAVVFKSETGGSSYDNVKALLESNGYEVSEIDPLRELIPEEADMVVINAPLNDYNNDVIEKLYNFLDNGGNLGKNLIYIADYSQKTTNNIDTFLSEWGIKIGDGVVGDMDVNNLQTQNYYVVRNYIESNDFSGNVSNANLPIINYQSRPIELLFDNRDTRSTVSLLRTKDTAFVMTNEMQEAMQNGQEPEIDYSAKTIMAMGRKYIFTPDNQQVFSNVFVIGSSEDLDEAFTSMTYYNNGEYFLSVVNSMTGKNNGIYIVEKDLTSPTFDIDSSKANKLFSVFVYIIPAAVVIAGIAMFVVRRKK